MLCLIVASSAALTGLAAWAATPVITIDPSEGRAGKNVTVTGESFAPGPVLLRWNAPDGPPVGPDAVANSAGQFSSRGELFRDASPGSYTVFAVQGALSATFPVVVTPPSPSSGSAPVPPPTDEVLERALDENEAKELADDDADDDPAQPAPAASAAPRPAAKPSAPPAPAPLPVPAPLAIPTASEVPVLMLSSLAPSSSAATSSTSRAPAPSLNDPRLQGAFSPNEAPADVNTIALRMLAVIPLVLVVLAMLGKLRYAIRSGTLWAR